MIQGITPALSALLAYGKRVSNTANNIANLATPGYKKSSTSSTELSPYQIATAGGYSQIGSGTGLQEVSRNFQQGSFEAGSAPTHMGINGDGFFTVRGDGDHVYYTRDGQFQFDEKGSLVNSQGHVVQGWEIDQQTGSPTGTMTDITMSSFSSPPVETETMTTIVNLNSGETDHQNGPGGLSAAWDGDDESRTYISPDNYGYSTGTKIYDKVGAPHDATLYFDKNGSGNEWEFIVTVNPSEDRRPNVTIDNIGLLGRGTLSFTDSGTIKSMTFETNDGTGSYTPQNLNSDLTDGHFTFKPDFQGAPNDESALSIQLDFGARYDGSNWVKNSVSSTQYAQASNTTFAYASGYGAGDLRNISVGNDGVISGSYSNGNTLDIFQVGVARFNNPQGLESLGQNLFSATSHSGAAITSTPGVNGLGTISPNSIEQSNVDIAEEFANLILFKTGYKANLKMLQMDDETKGDLLNIIS